MSDGLRRVHHFTQDARRPGPSQLELAVRERLARDPDALVKAFEMFPHTRRQLVDARPELRGRSDDEIALTVTGKPTRRHLRELEKRVADAKGTLRRVNRLEGEPLVDAALADGRVAHGERDDVLRRFEADPAEARAHLRTLQPDPLQASRNYWAKPENEAAYQAHARAHPGLRAENLVVPSAGPATDEDAYRAHARQLGLRDEEIV